MKCRHCNKDIHKPNPDSDDIGAWIHTDNDRLYCEGLVNRMAWPTI